MKNSYLEPYLSENYVFGGLRRKGALSVELNSVEFGRSTVVSIEGKDVMAWCVCLKTIYSFGGCD